MNLRRDLADRLSNRWAARLVMAAIMIALGYFGVTFSIAQVLAVTRPDVAYRLAPFDGRIAGLYATSLTGENATTADRVRADKVAIRALRQDPTSLGALATLGVNADVRGDVTTARRDFAYAQALSRRDLRTQLWMIEDAVGRGDVPAALRQYDITLRVFPNLGEMLYPVLASASTEPAIRTALIKILVGRPPWAEDFISFIAAKGSDPRSTIALFVSLSRAGAAPPAAVQATAVNAALEAGHPDLAWSYYATIRPRVDRHRSRDPGFAVGAGGASKFDWMPTSGDTALTADIQGGIFDFVAPASVGGTLLQQTQLLPPGAYRLVGHSIGIAASNRDEPYFVLMCQNGRELGRVAVRSSNLSSGIFSGGITVPPGCPVQILALVVRPSEAASGLSGQIDRIAIGPAAGINR